MGIKIKPYKTKHFFRFLVGLMDWKTLKYAGVFKRNVIKNIFKQKKEFQKFVIIREGKVVGGINLHEFSEGVFNIGCIIFKKYRNKGIAKKAVEKMIEYAKKKGAKKIVAGMYKNNSPSISIVKKLGYKKVKETEKKIYWEKKLK